MNILTIILDVLGILCIICFGGFLITLVADLVLSVFDKHEGVFFNKKHKNKETVEDNSKVVLFDDTKEKPYNNNKVEYITYEPKASNTTNFSTKQTDFSEYKDVDYEKAAEEQLMAMKAFNEKNHQSIKQDEDIIKVEEEKEDSKNFEDIINEVYNAAIEQLEKEKEEEKIEVKQNEEEPEKVKVVLPVVEEKEETTEDFRRIRENIFNIRRSAFNDLKDKERNNEATELENKYKQKLEELEALKAENEKMASEKAELLKFKNEAIQKNKKFEEEKEELESQLKQMEVQTGEISTAYFTEEEYKEKLQKLSEELKKAEKEYRRNRKEFVPLDRIHKSYAKDSEKLRRKEAIVAKHKISIYGVSNSSAIDPKKKQKLDEEVEVLRQLKESVEHCESVIEENKDRYPVLKRANDILSANVNRIKDEIEVCRKALLWFGSNK